MAVPEVFEEMCDEERPKRENDGQQGCVRLLGGHI